MSFKRSIATPGAVGLFAITSWGASRRSRRVTAKLRSSPRTRPLTTRTCTRSCPSTSRTRSRSSPTTPGCRSLPAGQTSTRSTPMSSTGSRSTTTATASRRRVRLQLPNQRRQPGKLPLQADTARSRPCPRTTVPGPIRPGRGIATQDGHEAVPRIAASPSGPVRLFFVGGPKRPLTPGDRFT